MKTFHDLQKNIGEYVYMEDFGMSAIAIASIIATRLQLSDPIWMVIIGPSSGGKSQILRPLALTDKKFMHRIDDLTENSLLSGSPTKKGEQDKSLLSQIGELGIIVISDFTVIFSKGSESRNAILSQFRMLYDGEMIKYVGTSSKPITWNGSIGILAGSTPSIYTHFEEVADMGERFIYYRMKPYNVEHATRLSMERKLFGKQLDNTLADLYADYIKSCVQFINTHKETIPPISKAIEERLITISMFAAKLRTPVHYDRFTKAIDKIPISEMPMRISLQLRSLVIGCMCMHYHDTNGESWEIPEEYISYIEWCAYSLANEERRMCLSILCTVDCGTFMRTQTIADKIGLNTNVIGTVLQHLAAVGLVERHGDDSSLTWRVASDDIWRIVRRMENMDMVMEVGPERELAYSDGEGSVDDINLDDLF